VAGFGRSLTGFRVDAIDLIPAAIEMARDLAGARALDIHYEVQDICELPHDGKLYDMIVDSYCLQCIVLAEDRRRVFSAVRARLKAEGYYLVSTAIMDEEHERLLEEGGVVRDASTGTVYRRYGDGLMDVAGGIAYKPLEGPPEKFPDAVRIAGKWHLPNRRHLKPEALEAELRGAGFDVIYRFPAHAGSVACVPVNRAN